MKSLIQFLLVCLVSVLGFSCTTSTEKHVEETAQAKGATTHGEEEQLTALESKINKKHDELMGQMNAINRRRSRILDLQDSLQATSTPLTKTLSEPLTEPSVEQSIQRDSLQLSALSVSLDNSSKAMFGWMRKYSLALDSSFASQDSKDDYLRAQIIALDEMQLRFTKTFRKVDSTLENY